jgi:hypothetical protein
VLANTKKFRVRSEKFHGGAGLRRCNRSRGFSVNFARHGNLRDNYRIFQGLNRKSFKSGSNDGGGYFSSNCHRSRAREVARSGANERGRRGDSIPYLTYRGDAPWRSNFMEEDAAAVPFICSGWLAPASIPGGAGWCAQAGERRHGRDGGILWCTSSGT